MQKDRFIQFAAVVIAMVALAGSTLLVGRINEQRRDLQLGFDVEIGDQVPPAITLAAQLGSFRGIATNMLWYRAEMMKRDGKFAEANTLANWITILQPRYPQVWSFQAWNMAYNISVETYTPEERWDWVKKGIELLRQQGIPYNPNAVRLYRELGWIFFHKVGQFTDDVNWYYKAQIAEEWEEVLGAAAESRDPDELTALFAPIAEMANAYFTADKPAVQVVGTLKNLADRDIVPGLAERYERLAELSVVPLRDRLEDLREELEDGTAGVAQLDQLIAMIDDQLQRSERDPVAAFREDFPEAAPVIDRLRSMDMALDVETLRAIGRCLMFLRLRSVQVVAEMPPEFIGQQAAKVLPMVIETLNSGDESLRRGLIQTVAFLRARVLIEHYHMDPIVMIEYMDRYGPLDWRHPAAHSLYWSQLGVDKYFDLRDTTKTDLLNTKRQVIHSLQLLTDSGTVAFDPFAPPYTRVDLLPNPEFIDGYLLAVDESKEGADAEEYGRIRADAFNQGEENFLQKAVMFSWLYGDQADAERYFNMLREDYGGDKGQASISADYNLSLGDFVASLIVDDNVGRVGMQAAINSRIELAFSKGLAFRRFQVFDRNLQVARAVHEQYQQEYGFETGLDVKQRMGLPPFPDMVYNGFTQFMTNASIPLLTRIKAYQNAYALGGQMPLAAATYDRFAERVREEAVAAGYDPDVALPRPIQPEQNQRRGPVPLEPQQPSTIQRQ
jgi:hypothetical protein